jgi:hypothetical protein
MLAGIAGPVAPFVLGGGATAPSGAVGRTLRSIRTAALARP